jgi:hypothetical protein
LWYEDLQVKKIIEVRTEKRMSWIFGKKKEEAKPKAKPKAKAKPKTAKASKPKSGPKSKK